MNSYITVDDIEQALIEKLTVTPFNYDTILCDSSMEAKDDIHDGTNRSSSEECVLPKILYDSLRRINPNVSEENIQKTVKELSKNFTGTDIVQTNYKLYNKIRENIQI